MLSVEVIIHHTLEWKVFLPLWFFLLLYQCIRFLLFIFYQVFYYLHVPGLVVRPRYLSSNLITNTELV